MKENIVRKPAQLAKNSMVCVCSSQSHWACGTCIAGDDDDEFNLAEKRGGLCPVKGNITDYIKKVLIALTTFSIL